MTDLFNRRHLSEVLAEAIPAAPNDPPVSFAIADLEEFKQVNDRHGHQADDYMLVEVSEAIRNTIRGSDLAFRYGGEEFAIIFPSTDDREVERVCERLRAAIDTLEIHWHGMIVRSMVSLERPPHCGDDPESIIHRADKALYRAKDRGRNRVMQG